MEPLYLRAALGIVLVTVVIYAPISRAGFVYEDHNWIGTLTRDQAAPLLQWPSRSLTQWSYQQQALLGPVEPVRFHWVNVGLHLLTGWAVYALARQMDLSLLSALAAAAVFLWHPLNVAAVAYLSARSDVLMTLGAVLAVVLSCSCRWWALLLVVPACLLSGAAKELGAMSFGLVLWTWKPRWVVWLTVIGVPLLAVTVTWREYGVYWPSFGTWLDVASANVMSLWRGLWLMIVPVGLNLDPDPWFWRMPERLVGLVALLWGAGWAWRSKLPFVQWALGWIALVMLPRLVMPTGEPIHDQHWYLAMVPVAIVLGGWIGAQRWAVECSWRF